MGGDLLVSEGVQAPSDTTAKQLFGYEQVAKADCEYPIESTHVESYLNCYKRALENSSAPLYNLLRS